MIFRYKYLFIFLHIFWLTLCLNGLSFAAEQVAIEDIVPDQIDSTLAKLSDEQIRSLLLEELSQKLVSDDETAQKGSGLIPKAAGWLHMLDESESTGEDTSESQASLSGLVSDLIAVAQKIGNGSMGGFFNAIGLLAAIFLVAFLVEFISRRFTAEYSRQFQEKAIPELDGPMRFIAGVMRAIPILIHILVFSVTAVVLFVSLPYTEHPAMRYLFLAMLFSITFYRILNQASLIICAPKTPSLRVLHMNDATATSVHRSIMLLCTYIFCNIMFLALLKEIQLGKSSFLFMINFVATLLIAIIIIGVLRSRNNVRERILAQSEINKTRNWVVEQFAKFWHVPTILYFIMVLAILIHSLSSGIRQDSPAFLLSLSALPLFLLFDGVGQWVVRASMGSLRIYNPDAEKDADEEMLLQLEEAKERERKITITAGRAVRLLILAALLIWAGSLWGYHIPYASDIAGAIFESLTALALGLTAWRFISSYIERKIAEATPEETEENSDDEFGGAAQRGRSYTLLPLVRKVIASTILVMVTLVILSAIGVDIGPLLAGAGVVGLAIGFGAQKLVSDVFSGFFYLLDDAFRVGEYIQAGSVSGAVESITLRNVMLRHHRGMLQIVPHSDLGSITNFMRGGIIVKFNLEFSYDANVDKIRKIIKKVGKAMLDDEEFAKDFINPVKSAGVREIKGSVMTIRVKFKAQPGTHFVIRREAYRRITEALNAQGIFYAHRKVIVELPEAMKDASPEEKQKVLEAGAAAELTQLEDDQKKAAESGDTKPGMPGM